MNITYHEITLQHRFETPTNGDETACLIYLEILIRLIGRTQTVLEEVVWSLENKQETEN